MLARAIVVFICLTAGWGVIATAERTEPVPLRVPFEEFPMQIGGWRGVAEPPLDDKIRAVLGADDYLTRAYFGAGETPVGLYIGYWKSQRQGDTIHSPLNCLPGSGWEPLSKTTFQVAVDPSRPDSAIAVNRYIVQKGLDRQLILYWYQSHGRVVASEYWSKFFLVTDAVRSNRTDAAIVRVSTPIAGAIDRDEERAGSLAVQFVQALFPILLNYLPSDKAL